MPCSSDCYLKKRALWRNFCLYRHLDSTLQQKCKAAKNPDCNSGEKFNSRNHIAFLNPKIAITENRTNNLELIFYKFFNHWFYCFFQEGGCSAPVAAHAELNDGSLSILAGVWSLDGTEKLTHSMQVRRSSRVVLALLLGFSYFYCKGILTSKQGLLAPVPNGKFWNRARLIGLIHRASLESAGPQNSCHN